MKFLKQLLGISEQKDASPSIYGATHAGRERDNNEDCFMIRTDKNLFIAADGMGGHNAGEVASLKATEVIDAHFTEELLSQLRGDDEKIADEMTKSLLNANEKIVEMAESNRQYRGMGCTIVVALIDGDLLHLCHVGDARAYLSNDAGINLLTTDHSTVMELVKAGKMTLAEARTSPLKNELSQAIGSLVGLAPDYCRRTLRDGDKVLLCTDGLWDMLTDEEIYEILHQELPVKTIGQKLIKTANSLGGHDNITVVVIEHKLHRESSQ